MINNNPSPPVIPWGKARRLRSNTQSILSAAFTLWSTVMMGELSGLFSLQLDDLERHGLLPDSHRICPLRHAWFWRPMTWLHKAFLYCRLWALPPVLRCHVSIRWYSCRCILTTSSVLRPELSRTGICWIMKSVYSMYLFVKGSLKFIV